MTPRLLVRDIGGIGAAVPQHEPALGADQLAAIRLARTDVVQAARSGSAVRVEAALDAYVRALSDASFSRYTVHALVEAALEEGVPTVRGRSRRALRSMTIGTWLAHGATLADALMRQATRLDAAQVPLKR
jgi:hypothetical protein